MFLLPFIHAFTEWFEQRAESAQLAGDDAYLAQAADHADLEFRQRDLARPVAWIPAYQ